MEDLKEITSYHFEWKIARDLFKIPSLRLLFIQGFFGVFPWNAITYWFFTYLETERGYSANEVLITMIIAVIVLALGYPLGGAIGDSLFKKNPRGRLIISTVGVITGAILLWITLGLPLDNQFLFLVFLSLTSLFIPFAAPNVISTVYDITLQEVRSSAQAIQSFIESAGSALSPLLVGIIADIYSLEDAFIIICVSTWVICALFFAITAIRIPQDIQNLRNQMRIRAETERKLNLISNNNEIQ